MATKLAEYIQYAVPQPESISFSIQKEGFRQRRVEFTLEELEESYLKEPGTQEMPSDTLSFIEHLREIELEVLVYQLPDFILEPEDKETAAKP
jgi:hypothetical protein